MGVDVARFGDDRTIIRFRQGSDARSIPPIKLRGTDTMQLAARIADENARFRCDAIFIDGGGVGGGVVDRCRQIGLKVTEVQFGARSDRAPIGAGPRDRLCQQAGRDLGQHAGLAARRGDRQRSRLLADLTGVEYGYVLREGRDAIQLERKEDMKKRGLASSDDGDALALTFAYPVAATDRHRTGRPQHQFEYDPFAHFWGQPVAGDYHSAAANSGIADHIERMRRLRGLPPT